MENHRVSIKYKQLHTNLINIPSSLSSIFFNAGINIQDVIVEIVLKAKSRSYCGWSGSTSSSPNTIEMDPVFAQSLNLVDMQQVVINMKLNNYESTQVSLEPLTPSDWELVELHAQVLEDRMMSQTRCVSPNQVLVVYPSQTTHAKLTVVDIGTKEHSYAKLSPMCTVTVAPKLRTKKSPSSKSQKSSKTINEDYSVLPSVLKRGIAMPHNMYLGLPKEANARGYEVYINYNEVTPILNGSEYVAVSVIGGSSNKTNTDEHSDAEQKTRTNTGPSLKGESNGKTIDSLKENKRVIAKLVDYSKNTPGMVGLSHKLAIALGVENNVGDIIILKPSVSSTTKLPSSFVVHPYILQNKKSDQVNLNASERKEKNSSLVKALSEYFSKENSLTNYSVTNYTKLPIISDVLPYGGLLRFKRNDDPGSWINPDTVRLQNKTIKFEAGEELLRSSSFTQSTETNLKVPNSIGLDDVLEDILRSVLTNTNSSMLVHGNPGSGKSLFLEIISKKLFTEYGYYIHYISCEGIMNDNFNQLTNRVTNWLQACTWRKPAALILDNLDKIVPAEQENVDSTLSNQVAEFLVTKMQKVCSQNNSNLFLLATSISKETLNKHLFQSHLIEDSRQLGSPDRTMRSKLIEFYLMTYANCVLNFDVMDLVSETEGYLPNDLKILSDRIYHEALFDYFQNKNNKSIEINSEHFNKALSGFTPTSLRGVKLERSSTSWSDIGGLVGAKNILLETLEWPTKYAPIFANCPLRLRSGILLYGYPGCGKTLLASAVAGQCGLNFISIKGPEILNKYIGASEQLVRELFERALSAKPCVLFFDEFDSIAPKRGHDSTGVTDRVVNQMLTQMDGAEGLDGVYVLAATSRPDLIDSALLRPGRLDKSVICLMPTYEDRLDILYSVGHKMNYDEDVELETIAKQSSGLSGADMQGLSYNAYLKAVHRRLDQDENLATKNKPKENEDEAENSREFFLVNPDSSKNERTADRVNMLHQIEKLFLSENFEPKSEKKLLKNDVALSIIVKQRDFLEALDETKPSISVSEKKKLDKIYREFVSSRDGNMPDGTPSNEVGGRTSLM